MIKKLGFVLIATFMGAATASAGMITDVLEPKEKISWWESFKYSHYILDDGFILGSALSGFLEITVKDDRQGWDEFAPEVILFTIEDFDFDTGGLTFFANGFSNELEVEALAELNADGQLDVTVTSMAGDFWLKKSILTVMTADEVPEPGTLALLGLGLVGLGAARRRKA